MPIFHIAMFAFNSSVPSTSIEDVCTRMLSLSSTCLHPESQTPYVKSWGGGRDNSPEGLQGGLTHVFISEFQNAEDRKYYLESDPVHLEFVKSLQGVVEEVRVMDFEAGVF